MIRLRDSIYIRTTPAQLFRWLEHMPEEYVSWHPDHVGCRVLKGSMLQVGSEIECKEYLHGKLHSMRFRLTRVLPGARVEFQIVGLGTGAFEALAEGEQLRFTAELGLGSDAPVFGRLVDAVLRVVFFARLVAMRQHMLEEGQNLKRILEVGWQPGTVSVAS